MIEIKINKKILFFVEVPHDAYSFTIEKFAGNTYLNYVDPSHKYAGYTYTSKSLNIYKKIKIISTTKDITEEHADKIVEKFEQPIGWRLDGKKSTSTIKFYQNYNIPKPVPVTFLYNDALESFQSLLKNNNIDTTKNYIILCPIYNRDCFN